MYKPFRGSRLPQCWAELIPTLLCLQAAAQPPRTPAHPARDPLRNMTCVRKLETKLCSARCKGSKEPLGTWTGSMLWDVHPFSTGLGSAPGRPCCHLLLTKWKLPE